MSTRLLIKPGTILIAICKACQPEQAKQMADASITVFAMELVPRISRAQSMDVLSSQSSFGYKAVLDACNEYTRAANDDDGCGDLPPARVLVRCGCSRTSSYRDRRLGAVVSHTMSVPRSKKLKAWGKICGR